MVKKGGKKNTPGIVKKSDVTFRKGVEHSDVSIVTEGGIARLKFKCVMDEGGTQIAKIAMKFLPGQRIDFQSVDGRFNLSIRNGAVNVSNARKDDAIEVDQTWVVGRACGRLGEEVSWILRESTLIVEGDGDIPDYAEAKDAPWYIYRSNIRKLEIRGDIRSIGKRSFNKYRNLIEADLGNATIVANRAFAGCPSLAEVKMDCIQAVNAFAFSDCQSIRGLRFGAKLKKIDKSAFSGCSSLGRIVFNCADVPYIGESSFTGCLGLTAVSCLDDGFLDPGTTEGVSYERRKPIQLYAEDNPESEGQHMWTPVSRVALTVKTVDAGGNVFSEDSDYSVEPAFIGAERAVNLRISYCGVSSLLRVVATPVCAGVDGVEWRFDPELGVLDISGFGDMPDYDATCRPPWDLFKEEIREVNVSDGVSCIGKRAFDGCRSLTIVRIDSVRSIRDRAFRNCISLECVRLSAAETIGSFAFQGCSKLLTVIFGENIAKIGKHSFDGCKDLVMLRFLGVNVPALDVGALEGIASSMAIMSRFEPGWADAFTTEELIYKAS